MLGKDEEERRPGGALLDLPMMVTVMTTQRSFQKAHANESPKARHAKNKQLARPQDGRRYNLLLPPSQGELLHPFLLSRQYFKRTHNPGGCLNSSSGKFFEEGWKLNGRQQRCACSTRYDEEDVHNFGGANVLPGLGETVARRVLPCKSCLSWVKQQGGVGWGGEGGGIVCLCLRKGDSRREANAF